MDYLIELAFLVKSNWVLVCGLREFELSSTLDKPKVTINCITSTTIEI